MWREFIQTLVPAAAYPIDVRYAPGVNEVQEALLEAELGFALPSDLRTLLQESNGIRDQYGSRFIWSIEEIAQYNQEMRTFPEYSKYYMSFADMFFFADAGNGDRFAFPIIQGKCQEGPIYSWDHEDDTRMEIASSLKAYLEGWLSGKMSV